MYITSLHSTRQEVWETLEIPKNLAHTSCGLVDFVFWLDTLNSPNARDLIKHILTWLGMMFEFSDWRSIVSDEPTDVPILEGPQRARRISRRWRIKMVRMAAAGYGLKSPAHVLQMMKRFKKGFFI